MERSAKRPSCCSAPGASGRRCSSDTSRSVAMSRTPPSDLVERGRRVLELEAGARGRVIVSGVGKSGLIARKIAATLTSTGTAAAFLHPVDSLHGDLGMVGRDDVAVLLSKSGSSEELFGLVEQLQRLGVPIIALTGDLTS